MSPGLLTPPSRAAHFGRPMASPINLSPQSTSHLIPAPLHPLPRSPTASLHPPLPAFHFPAAPTPDNILPIPPPRRPVDAYAPYPENSGLSVIGEEIEDFLSSNSSGARGPSHPTSRQSPKHSRTPSTFSAHHRPLRDRDRDRERSRASLVLSSAGSVDSNPRFMSIHSWVNHQSNRIGAGPSGSGSNSGSGSASHSASRSRSHSHSGSGSPFERRSDITPGESGDMAVSPGYDEYQGMRRMDSTSTATVFRQHPGDRIEMSRGSVIPSDVLDSVQYNEGNVL
ncbi:MAG: hypothetical protein M1814_004491 [Vezdaea aestivalis]|nr:MAG: hypothetical protein M1814_004491 [Vezdaea aestivalis]